MSVSAFFRHLKFLAQTAKRDFFRLQTFPNLQKFSLSRHLLVFFKPLENPKTQYYGTASFWVFSSAFLGFFETPKSTQKVWVFSWVFFKPTFAVLALGEVV